MSNLYKVSSVFNICLPLTKQVNYKVLKQKSEKLGTFVIAEQSDWSKGKFLLR